MFGSPPDTTPRVRRVRPARPTAVFACGKCLKKAKNGKAVRRALKDALALSPAGPRGKAPRMARTACLGLCPKGAVVLASAATLLEGDMVLVRDASGVAAAMPVLLPHLRPDPDRIQVVGGAAEAGRDSP